MATIAVPFAALVFGRIHARGVRTRPSFCRRKCGSEIRSPALSSHWPLLELRRGPVGQNALGAGERCHPWSCPELSAAAAKRSLTRSARHCSVMASSGLHWYEVLGLEQRAAG